ncbi:hypothetical protein VSS74_04185 [Conexibacter stalactiti]|uniref:Uncharacterized protein n=1 Tax=Conexibacter stalactiti TaxID=1940611 RepID=A0ABU4HJM6_9ACTN|nr:hypothetical protein [Conexibacter stalactiti]MDW5593521.1 hypothetical protein [Conexibacter stalactiti]MEC5034162.1 hypothetical protein [Conexibacter stalactiti]
MAIRRREARAAGRAGRGTNHLIWRAMSPFWIWMQVAIVITVLAGIVIAIVKLL